METLEYKIAQAVKQMGGNTYYVGGYVRDQLLGIDNKDIDIEVHGIKPEELLNILKSFGSPKIYGESFGIYGLNGIDIAMPRKEHATGRGHRDFEVNVDPYIGTLEASRRRDFTINALMKDVLTGEIIDHFDGVKDLKNKIIRHIDDDSFIEDPLRVFRAAQFAARFNFNIDEKTLTLCETIDVETLSKERIEAELKKALIKSNKPSIFFEVLKDIDKLSYWFIELNKLIDLPQDPIYHPEGDVFRHTMDVLDRGSLYLDKVSNPYGFMLTCLCHDLGKIVTTTYDGDRIHSYNHETEGLPIIREFLHRFTDEKDVIHYVINMSEHHMKPSIMANDKSSLKSTNHMFDEVVEPKDLIYFSICDNPKLDKDKQDFLFDRLGQYQEIMSKPYVSGDDLIEAGIKPGEGFSEILEYAHKLRLAGVNKQDSLAQTLAYAKKVLKYVD